MGRGFSATSESPTFTGTWVYTKGTVRRKGGREIFHVDRFAEIRRAGAAGIAVISAICAAGAGSRAAGGVAELAPGQ
jgi:hypothetical protein